MSDLFDLDAIHQFGENYIIGGMEGAGAAYGMVAGGPYTSVLGALGGAAAGEQIANGVDQTAQNLAEHFVEPPATRSMPGPDYYELREHFGPGSSCYDSEAPMCLDPDTTGCDASSISDGVSALIGL